jgi:hypothetical protein
MGVGISSSLKRFKFFNICFKLVGSLRNWWRREFNTASTEVFEFYKAIASWHASAWVDWRRGAVGVSGVFIATSLHNIRMETIDPVGAFFKLFYYKL